MKKIIVPFTKESAAQLIELRAGDIVELYGDIITGRDAAHKRMFEAIDNLPFEIKGQCIYYVGPCPAAEGEIIGPCGPTTAGRVDAYTPILLDKGLKAMIGKGLRSKAVVESMKKNGAVYFAATGGAASLIQRYVKKSQVVAYDDLGAEAVYRLTVEGFPVIVAIDALGNNQYELGKKQYSS